jgi:hypothetical protein
MGGIVNNLLAVSEMRMLFMAVFPGLMRSAMMFLWMALLLFPMSKALEEVKIGQWEVFLSNSVGTRDILAGTFFGTIPLYSIVTLFLAPILVSPFLIAFEVSLLGTAFIYGTLILTVVTALWLSNFITSAIQSRLGESPRGNDIAKALSLIIAIVALVPMYGIMYAAPMISEILGMNIFLLLPFTWSADLISWLAIAFNGVALTPAQIHAFSSVLQLDLAASVALVSTFSFVVFIGTIMGAGRIFTIAAGSRTEVVTTVGSENIFVRNIRRIGSPSFGSLLAVNTKDYFRKAQNLSKMFYGLVLAILLPTMMVLFTDSEMDLQLLLISFGMMFGIVGGFPQVGTGFLESKNQLWILQSAPNGASRYVHARVVMAVVMDLILTAIPVSVLSLLLALSLREISVLVVYGLIMGIGSSMVAIGVTAKNPDYEDTKSAAHQMNVMTTVMIPLFAIVGSLFLLILLGVTGMADSIIALFGEGIFEVLFNMLAPSVVFLVGLIMIRAGISSLSSPD